MDTKAPEGKLGVLIPGLGAVSTTFIAGVDAIIQGRSAPIGSVSQMGTIRLGKRTKIAVQRSKNLYLLLNYRIWFLVPGIFLKMMDIKPLQGQRCLNPRILRKLDLPWNQSNP